MLIAQHLARPTRTVRRAQARSRPYLVLLQAGFALPRLLPAARWALTSPFHPCHHRSDSAVCFLWHSPSPSRPKPLRRPGVTWQRAQWSPDFPRCTETVRRDYPVVGLMKNLIHAGRVESLPVVTGISW